MSAGARLGNVIGKASICRSARAIIAAGGEDQERSKVVPRNDHEKPSDFLQRVMWAEVRDVDAENMKSRRTCLRFAVQHCGLLLRLLTQSGAVCFVATPRRRRPDWTIPEAARRWHCWLDDRCPVLEFSVPQASARAHSPASQSQLRDRRAGSGRLALNTIEQRTCYSALPAQHPFLPLHHKTSLQWPY